MDGGTVVFKFEGDTKNLEKSTNNVGSIIKGVLGSSIIQKGISTITSSLDDAIARVDTLNNFPKVMKNMGISAEDSSEAIQMVSDSIQGLPTTLDSAAASVQRFTSKNGDVKLSAKMFSAVNNAIVAGAAPTETQATALEQLTQAYSKGKPDLMEWRSLMTAMPAQLSQVAQAMGYVNTDGLYDALKNGEISMDDFMNAMINLNENGTGEFASFEEQAKGSVDGIGTSITNMKTAVVRGVANMIDQLNSSLAENNLPTLPEIIQKITQGINTAFNAMLPVIQAVIPVLAKVFDFISAHPEATLAVASAVATLVAGFKTMSSVGEGISNISTGFNLLKSSVSLLAPIFSGLLTVIKLVGTAFKVLGTIMLANPIVLIIAGIVALVAAIVVLYNKCEWFRNFVNGALSFIGSIFSTVFNGIKTVVQTVFEFIVNVIQTRIEIAKLVIQTAINIIVGIFNFLKTGVTTVINAVKGGLSGFINLVKSIPTKIVNVFKAIPGKMLSIGSNLLKGLWNGIKNAKEWLVGKIKSLGKTILKAIKGIFGIHSPSTEFAWIGKMNMVGLENGMEDMQPKVQSMIDGMFDLSPNVSGSASNHYSPSLVANVDVNMTQDPLGQMVRKIKTYSGGAKNDYNYGMGV